MTKTALLIGFGAMGRTVYQHLENIPNLRITHILESAAHQDSVRAATQGRVQVISSVDALSERPDFAVECAGHGAVLNVVPALLAKGIPTIIASIGSLSTPGLVEKLDQACRQGGTQLIPVAGALAGMDALAAAREAGLDSVQYVGRKAPLSWSGTAAEKRIDLAALTEATVFFEGTAREAAATFPQNANVAAMAGLSGLGLDQTEVKLVADPAVTRNTHVVIATGVFGRMEVKIEAAPLAANPKTSALAAYSIIRQARLQAATLCF